MPIFRTSKCLPVAATIGWMFSAPGFGSDASANQDYLDVSGRVSVGLDHLSDIDNRANGGSIDSSRWRRGGNNWGTSLLDIAGAHSIGDYAGLGHVNVSFLLESGFDADRREFNGNTFLNRRAYVALGSSKLGTLLMGKNLSLSIDTYYIDPFYQQYVGSETLVRGRNWQGVDNMVGYKSPTWNGWTAQLQFGLGGESGKFNAQRSDAASINYTGPMVTYYAIYDQRRDADGHYSSVFLHSKEWVTGAKAHLGRWDLFAGYNRLDATDVLSISEGGDGYRHAQHSWLGAHWWVTPAWRLQAAVYHIDVSDGGGSANLPVVGTTYDLSHNFMVYASYGRVLNNSVGDFSAEATDNRPAPGRNQNAFYFGFVYSFDKAFGHPPGA